MRGAFWQHYVGRRPKPRRDDLVRLPQRAWILEPEDGELAICCKHFWESVPADELRADLEQAHKTNTPQERRRTAQ